MPRQSVLAAREPTVGRVHNETQCEHQLPQAAATVNLEGEHENWRQSHIDDDWRVRLVSTDAADHVGEGLIYLQARVGDFRHAQRDLRF